MNSKYRIYPWIAAARLRTLPLAASGVLMGGVLAAIRCHEVDVLIFLQILMLATLLQVLSNYANDYGDYFGGADHSARKGPRRQLQSGTIQPEKMKIMIVALSALSLFLGLSLAFQVFGAGNIWFYTFTFLGAVSIWAAVKYTVGQNAYGYRALGDLFVFLFFGLVAVLGGYTLLTIHECWTWALLLPATSVGLLSVGVLNLNNIRDMESDFLAGKRTVPHLLGIQWAKIYQSALVVLAVVALSVFNLLHHSSLPTYIYLVLVYGFGRHILKVWRYDPDRYDPLLKELSLLTIFLVITFALGHGLANFF